MLASTLLLVASSILGTASAPVAAGGVAHDLCSHVKTRAKSADNFAIDVCFDGRSLYLRNKTVFVLAASAAGDIGAATRIQPTAPELASLIVSAGTDEWTLPPGFGLTLPVGSGEATLKIAGGTKPANDTYVFARAVSPYIPPTAPYEAASSLISDLEAATLVATECRKAKQDALGYAGCTLRLGWEVNVAALKAGLKLSTGIAGALVNLIETAPWGAEAVSQARQFLLESSRTLTISSAPVPATPEAVPATPEAPKAPTWLYDTVSKAQAVGPSGVQRPAVVDGKTSQQSTGFWVGCEGQPAVTTFRLGRRFTTMTTVLALDPGTPADLVVAVSLAVDGRSVGSWQLRPGQPIPVTAKLSGAAFLSLTAQAVGGVCTASSVGYGIAFDAKLRS